MLLKEIKEPLVIMLLIIIALIFCFREIGLLFETGFISYFLELTITKPT